MTDKASYTGDTALKYEEPDIPTYDLSESTWNPEETNNLGSAHGTEAFLRTPQVTEKPVRILIVGPSGSGKTYTIKDSYCGTKKPMVGGPYEATKRVSITRLRCEGQIIELIDTPGFDNICMSDVEAFAETADYLLDPKHIQAGINGVIYVHRAGNPVRNRCLLRNFRVLANVFLGKGGMTRLTFLITQCGFLGIDHGKILDQMQAPDSIFSQAFPLSTKIATSPDRRGFIKTLQSYISQTPIILPVQLDDSYKSLSTFVTRVENELGYYEHKSAQSLLGDQERQLRELYEQKLANQRKSEGELRQQLQRLQLDYFSLQSQLQLQKSTEPNHVAQTLENLNRTISDIGSSLSAHLTGDYILATFGKDPSDISALRAVDLPELKTLLGHVDGKSSLISSSDGHGMPIERFFDYSIRSMICHYLVKSIFEPFHPGISSSLSQSLLATYKKLQKQDSQASTSKWRSETFKSIYGGDCSDAAESDIDHHTNKLINERLKPLLKYVFGFDVALEGEHHTLLRRIVTIAWGWNSNLKGSDFLLEDIVQTAFRHPCRLNPELMEEFETKSGSQEPTHVLATLGLGLLSRTAIGGGNPIEQKTIYKALVVTNNSYS